MTKIISITEYLIIDPTSPSGLRWNKRVGVAGGVRYPGDIAGSLSKQGYWEVRFQNKLFRNHRVIYEMYFNVKIEPGFYIDHINGVRSDNSISNLRVVSPSVNNKNIAKRSNNTLIGGVGSCKRDNGFICFWRDKSGRSRQKFFSINKYGLLEANQMAIIERKRKLQELISYGLEYTERHGT